eukprot:CAMPEP_0114152860 /NCGR_PEP_ID=MMETSP0043_2-20121206/24041_1 /TAXON_ID=464988 /ORGANISM="Hemiselmis andersenii, Strain CCMP644" /LENGTH=37 /DNA_ID= /DNA_START= /DNA_END= /DNA_ORIENTATION=
MPGGGGRVKPQDDDVTPSTAPEARLHAGSGEESPTQV